MCVALHRSKHPSPGRLRGAGVYRAAPLGTDKHGLEKNKYKRTDQLPARHRSKPRLDGRPDLRREHRSRVRAPLLRHGAGSTNVALRKDTARRDQRTDVEELFRQGLLAGRSPQMGRERLLAFLGFRIRLQVEGRRQGRIRSEGPDGHGAVQEARVDVLRVLAVDDDDLCGVNAIETSESNSRRASRRRRVVA